jgi:hypothetical protein
MEVIRICVSNGSDVFVDLDILQSDKLLLLLSNLYYRRILEVNKIITETSTSENSRFCIFDKNTELSTESNIALNSNNVIGNYLKYSSRYQNPCIGIIRRS